MPRGLFGRKKPDFQKKLKWVLWIEDEVGGFLRAWDVGERRHEALLRPTHFRSLRSGTNGPVAYRLGGLEGEVSMWWNRISRMSDDQASRWSPFWVFLKKKFSFHD